VANTTCREVTAGSVSTLAVTSVPEPAAWALFGLAMQPWPQQRSGARA
jgi:hypothetical protein